MEGPPAPPEKKEQEEITNEQCLEAMKAGNFEVVGNWYAQEGKKADQNPTGRGHFDLTVRLSTLQFESGVIDEETGENYGFATLDGALLHAVNAQDFETAAKLDTIIKERREQQKRGEV